MPSARSRPSPPRTARVVTAVVVWLAIGAVINVGVVWATYLLPFGHRMRQAELAGSMSPSGKTFVWSHAVHGEWPEAATIRIRDTSIFDDVVFLGTYPPMPRGRTAMVDMTDHFAGVPLRCLEWWHTTENGLNGLRNYQEVGRDHYAWRVHPPFLGAASLPLAPVWPGFAVNTLFYAAIVWGLCLIPAAIRRGLRRRAGQCVKCGYDRRGLPEGAPCPECAGPAPGV